MPYKTIADLPKQVQGLPKHAKEIFKSAFNASVAKWGEERAFKIAWGAVKQKYVKSGDKWVRKLAEFMEKLPAINLDKELAKMVWEGSKSLIIHDKNYRFISGKRFYLVDEDSVWGVIKLTGAPQEVSVETFKKLSERHRVKNEERIKKWGGRRKLYAYGFEFEKFEVPKRIEEHEQGITFLNSVEFTVEKIVNELIDDSEAYEPSKLDNEILAEDWKTVNRWELLKDGGQEIPFTNEKIYELKEKIYDEVEVRLERDGVQACFIPLYHLALKKAKSKVVSMTEFFEPMHAFSPKKSGSNFFDLEELVGFLYNKVR